MALLACQSPAPSLSAEGLRAQADTIRGRMDSYAAALVSLDPERILGHYVRGPEFRLHSDGQILSYDDMVSVAGGMRASLRSLEVHWDTVEVTSLGPDAAIAGAPFRRVLTDTAGTVTRDRGTASWVWVRRDGEWRSIHGHGVHIPEPAQPR